jgi:hypothetical protein
MSPELRERLDEVLRDIGFGRLVGVEVLDWEPGRARTRLVPGAEQTNVHGFVHGGALFAVADTAFEVACNSYGREPAKRTCAASSGAISGGWHRVCSPCPATFERSTPSPRTAWRCGARTASRAAPLAVAFDRPLAPRQRRVAARLARPPRGRR